jgi:hypothetical protein
LFWPAPCRCAHPVRGDRIDASQNEYREHCRQTTASGHPVYNEKKTLEYIRHRLIGMGSILLLAVQGKKRNARGKGSKTCFGRVEENVSAKSSIF